MSLQRNIAAEYDFFNGLLGLEDSIDSIEPGKFADLVLIDTRVPELTPLYDVYSQLVYVIKGGHVGTVLVGGRFVVRNREMTTPSTSTR